MASPIDRILLAGATGYVGGTVLDHLIKCQEPLVQKLTFDVLVRSEDAGKKLLSVYGDRVHPIEWKGLDDTAFIADTAANYDFVLNAGTGLIPDGAKAFVQGLARRVKPGRPAPWLLHLSGSTNFADHPLTGTAHPDREWDDADGGAVYDFLKREEERDPYPQRTAEVGVLTAADETGVQALSLNAPCVIGAGSGLFSQRTVIIPLAVRYVVSHGYGFKLTETANIDWVHVADLADLYVLLVKAILSRDDCGVGYIPSGKKGIIFPAAGRVLITDIMQSCLDVAFGAGVLPREDTPKEKEIRQVSLQEIADETTSGSPVMSEHIWASTKSQKGTMAKRLFGWNPTRLEEAWRQYFIDELNALRDGKRGHIR